jgi:hypothetical protein
MPVPLGAPPIVRSRSQYNVLAGFHQTIDRDECIVLIMADQVAPRVDDAGDVPCRRPDRTDLSERPFERVENAIELHAHLERERPAGVVVRRRRRRAGVRNDVRMILRLEHVEHVRPERLRGADHEGTRRVARPIDAERLARALDSYPILQQRVDELGRGQEIGLIRWNDIPARIAHSRIASIAGAMRRGCPRVAIAAIDRVLPHPPHVVEQISR